MPLTACRPQWAKLLHKKTSGDYIGLGKLIGSAARRVKAQREGSGAGSQGDMTLTLTEFPDPNGKCVYFRAPDLSVAVKDELLSN